MIRGRIGGFELKTLERQMQEMMLTFEPVPHATQAGVSSLETGSWGRGSAQTYQGEPTFLSLVYFATLMPAALRPMLCVSSQL